jgi:hypothetical protein
VNPVIVGLLSGLGDEWVLVDVKNAPYLVVAEVRVFLASGAAFGLLLEMDGSFY